MSDQDITIQFVAHPSAKKFIDLTNRETGRLIVLGYAGKRGYHHHWYCKCVCGKTTVVSGQSIRNGHTRSCGCMAYELTGLRSKTHGASGSRKRGVKPSPELIAFRGAKARCSNPKDPNYHHYGGRGIKFLFNTFEEFLEELGRKPTPKHTVERQDVNGNYEQGNVCWATMKEQQNNRRSNRIEIIDGIPYSLSEWCDIYKTTIARTWNRLHDGWCIKCALTLPFRSSCPHR